MEPEKYTWFEFIKYLLRPIKMFWDWLNIKAKKNLLGYWYCEYCEGYHSPRTKKYAKFWNRFITVCSLGLDKSY